MTEQQAPTKFQSVTCSVPSQRQQFLDTIDPHGSVDYTPLVDAAIAALEQAMLGKGRERHAHGRDFTDQPILVIPRLLGDAGVGFLIGQAMKKAEESLKLPLNRKLAELRGAVIYLLATTIHIVESELADPATNHDHRTGFECPVLGCERAKQPVAYDGPALYDSIDNAD